MDEENEQFSKSESSPLRMLFSFCLIFYQFQPGDAYKNVAYKKSVYLQRQLQLLLIIPSILFNSQKQT